MNKKGIKIGLMLVIFTIISSFYVLADYTPATSISSSSYFVKAGQPFSITASATDDIGLFYLYVWYANDWHLISCNGYPTCSVTIPLTEVASDNYYVYSVYAYDTAWQTSTSSIEVAVADCLPGETRNQDCGTSGIGVCKIGTQTSTCDANGYWGAYGVCSGAVTPTTETCNGLDDNCDGTTDNGLIITCSSNTNCNDNNALTADTCNSAGTCSSTCTHTALICAPTTTSSQSCGVSNTGSCSYGTQTRTCDANGNWGTYGSCNGEIDPTTETCNGLDDNCDGIIDNGLTATCSNNAGCNDNNALTADTCNNAGTCSSTCTHTALICAPTTTSSQSCGIGSNGCSLGSQTRTCDSNGNWGTYGTCSGATTPTCSNNSECNDGNRLTLDSCNNAGTCSSSCAHTPVTCLPGDTSSQSCGGAGACSLGTETRTCQLDYTWGSYGSCSGDTYPSCSSNSDCNDGNIHTSDSCNSGGSCSSSCSYSTINQAPTISTGNQNINENNTLGFTVSANDADGDALTYSAAGLPSGATFNTTTKTFNWTPNFTQSGNYSLNLSVNDGYTTTLKIIIINVTNVNRAPAFNSIINQTTNENQSLTFTINASDPDLDVVNYGIVGMPVSAAFNTSNGTFSWTPNFTESGVYNLTFNVSDGTLSALQSINITVYDVNRAPILNNISNQSVNENQTLNFTITAFDPDGDNTTYSAVGLPGGATFNISTQIFNFTPNFTQSGNYSINFTVSDGQLNSTQTVIISVNNTNRAPMFLMNINQTVNENQTLTFNLNATDADGDALNFYTNSSVGILNITSGLFNWTPNFTESGQYTFYFNTTDGNLWDFTLINVTVNNTNLAPVIDFFTPNTTINETDSLFIWFNATDFDSNIDAYKIVIMNGTNLSQTINGNSTNFTTNYLSAGNYTITYFVNDTINFNDTKTANIEVLNMPVAPVITIWNPNITTIINETQNITINFTYVDQDNNTNITQILINGTVVSNTTSYIWNTSYNDSGEYNITYYTQDLDGLNDTKNFTLIINNTNRFPVFGFVQNYTINETYNLNISINATDADIESLTFGINFTPANSNFIDNLNNTANFNFTPNYTQNGTYNFMLNVTDGIDTVTKNFTVTVLNLNRAPVLQQPINITANETTAINFALNASDADPEDVLTYSATGLPSGAALNSTSGYFNWSTNYSDAGIYNITFTANDGRINDSKNMTITVVDVQTNIYNSWIYGVYFPINTTLEVFNTTGVEIDNSTLINNTNITNTTTLSVTQINLSTLQYSILTDVTDIYNCTSNGSSSIYNILTSTTCVNQIIDPTSVVNSNITGSTQITNSKIYNSNATYSIPISNSTINSSDVNNSSIYDSVISYSIVYNSIINNSKINNSLIQNGNLTGSIVNDSSVVDSKVDNSTLSKNSNVSSSDISSNSVLTNTSLYTSIIINSVLARSNINLSNATNSNITESNITSSNLFNLIILRSILENTNATDSNITDSISINSNITDTTSLNSNITTSILKNSKIINSVLNDTNATYSNFTNSTSINSNITNSIVLNSNITNSNSANSNIVNSNISLTTTVNSTVTDSFISSSVINLSVVHSSNITSSNSFNSTLNYSILNLESNVSNSYINNSVITVSSSVANSSVINSVLTNSSVTNTSISNTSLSNMTIMNGNVTNGQVQAGSQIILSNGTVLTVNQTMNITSYSNHKPVANFSLPGVLNINTSVQFTDQSTDQDINGPLNDQLTYFWDFGDGINSTTQNATHIFGNATNYSVSLTVTDIFGLSDNITKTVSINTPPIILFISNYTVNENQTLTITINASDADNDTLAFNASGLPSNSNFTDNLDNSSTFNFTPNFTQSGNYTITIRVNDTKTTVSQNFTVTVNNVNIAPILIDPGNKSVAENQTLTFALNASDFDNDTLNYTASGLPSGASLNISTGLFSWTPNFTQNGTYNLNFTVNDSFLISTQSINITVNNTNRAPVAYNLINATIQEDSSINFTINCSDPDGDTFSYNATSINGSINSFNQTIFTYTPNLNFNGFDQVTYTCNDSTLTSNNATVYVNVTAVNDAPVANNMTINVSEDSSIIISLNCTDPDGPSLSYSITTFPTHGTFIGAGASRNYTPAANYYGMDYINYKCLDSLSLSNIANVSINVTSVDDAPVLIQQVNITVNETDIINITLNSSDFENDTLTYYTNDSIHGSLNSTTGDFYWNTTYNDSGVYNILFIAGDGTLNNTKTVNITVLNINRAPTLIQPNNITANETSLINFTLNGTDPDSQDTLNYNAYGLPVNATLNITTGKFIWNSTYFDAGTYNVTFTVSDGRINDSKNMTIVILNLQVAPIITTWTPNATTTINETNNITFSFTYNDPDNNSNTTQILLNGTVVSNTTSYTWNTTYNDVGAYNITYYVNDSDGLFDQKEIVFIINNTDRAPVLQQPNNITINETDIISFMLNASDADNDTISYFTNDSTHGFLNSSTGVFYWNTTYNDSGNYTITWTAGDGLLNNSRISMINVLNVNRAPVAYSLNNFTIQEDSPINLTINCSDPDGDIFSYSANASNGTISAVNQTAFTYSSNLNFNGQDQVIYKCNDSTLTSSNATVNITITPVNDAPTAQNIITSTLENIPINITLICSDVDFDTLNYYDPSTPNNGSLVQINQTTYTYTSNSNYRGIDIFTYSCDDNVLPSNTANISVTVDVVLVLQFIQNYTISEGQTLNISINASDIHNDSLRFNAKGLPSNSNFIDNYNNTASFSFSPNYTQNGTYLITVNVTNNISVKNQTFRITVNNTNRAPVLQQPNNFTINETNIVNFTLNGTELDPEDTITYSAVGLPVNATLNSTTGNVYWNTTYFDSGVYNITFTLSDGTLNDSKIMKLVVNNINRVPIFGALSNYSINESQYITFTLNTSDPDNEALTHTTTTLPSTSTFNATSKVFSWNTGYGDAGLYNITFIVSDGNISVNQTIMINITNVPANIYNSWIYGVYFQWNSTADVFNAVGVNIDGNTVINNTNITNSSSPRITQINLSSLQYSKLNDVTQIYNCTSIGSLNVYNILTNLTCIDQFIDPTTITNSNVTGTTPITNSTIQDSNVTNSGPVTDSTVNSSNVNDSVMDNATVTNSDISGSTINDSRANNATVDNANITGGSTVNDSTVANSTVQNSDVTNSTVENTDTTNSTVTNTNATDSTLTNTNTTSSTITNTTTTDSTLTNTNTTDSTLTNTVSTNSTIDNTDTTNSTVTNTNATDSTLTNTNAANSSVTNTNTTDSTLTNTVATNSSVDNTNATGSSLTNTNATDSTLTNTTTTDSSITNTNTSGSTIDNTTITDSTVTNSNTSDSTLTNADAINSTVTNTQVTNSTLDNTTITDSSVTNTNTTDSTLTNTNTTDSTISGTNVTDSTLTNSKVTNATLDNANISSNSTVVNTTITDSTVSNATVSNANVSSNSTISDSTVISSTISNATIDNANVSTGSVISDSSVSNSTVSNATVDNAIISANSTVIDSTVVNSTVKNATLDNVNISSNSTITDSTITDSTITNSSVSQTTLNNSKVNSTTIANTSLSNIVIFNGNVSNGVIQNGSQVQIGNGSLITITQTTSVSDYFNHNPLVNFALPITNYVNSLLSFTDSSSDQDTNLFDSIASYLWSFGDGQTSTSRNPTHTFNSTSSYSITLTVTDTFGLQNSTTKTLNIITTPSATASTKKKSSGGGGAVIKTPNITCSEEFTCQEWETCDAIGVQKRTCNYVNNCSSVITQIRECNITVNITANETINDSSIIGDKGINNIVNKIVPDGSNVDQMISDSKNKITGDVVSEEDAKGLTNVQMAVIVITTVSALGLLAYWYIFLKP